MGVTSEALYEKLKKENMYGMLGHSLFIGINDSRAHKYECIRINCAKD